MTNSRAGFLLINTIIRSFFKTRADERKSIIMEIAKKIRLPGEKREGRPGGRPSLYPISMIIRTIPAVSE
jgi:hypothetical protein